MASKKHQHCKPCQHCRHYQATALWLRLVPAMVVYIVGPLIHLPK